MSLLSTNYGRFERGLAAPSCRLPSAAAAASVAVSARLGKPRGAKHSAEPPVLTHFTLGMLQVTLEARWLSGSSRVPPLPLPWPRKACTRTLMVSRLPLLNLGCLFKPATEMVGLAFERTAAALGLWLSLARNSVTRPRVTGNESGALCSCLTWMEHSAGCGHTPAPGPLQPLRMKQTVSHLAHHSNL